MSDAEPVSSGWLEPDFLDRLNRLQDRHRRLETDHQHARRRLEAVTPQESEELRDAWRDYCDVVAELDQTSAEFETLRNFKS